MKRIFLAALMAGAASSAFAADLPTRKAPSAPSPYYAAPAFTWTGLYVGVNGGYGYGGLSNTNFGKPDGGFVGGTIGYNYQFGQFVVGVEGDLDWADMKKGNSFPSLLGPGGASTSYKIDAMVTDRLRLGYAIDRALLYVTGGYAGMETKASIFDPNAGTMSRDTWRNGGVIGGGIEYAFTNNITAKAEYLYAPMQDKSYWGGTPYAETNRLNVSLFRVGLNYKF